MAKGKEAIKAANRRAQAAENRCAALRAQLDDAKSELLQLRDRTAGREALVAEVERLRAQAEDGSSDALESLQERYYQLVRQLTILKQYVERVKFFHTKTVAAALTALGGGSGSFSDLMSLLNDRPAVMTTNDYMGPLPTKVIKTIETKRDRAYRCDQNMRARNKTLTQLLESCPDSTETIRMLLRPADVRGTLPNCVLREDEAA